MDELQDIGIYEIDADMVENVYRIGDIERVRSQFVHIELDEGRCCIIVGQACQEQRDFYICEALAHLCQGPLTVSDLLIIFTHPVEVLDLIYPDDTDGADARPGPLLTIQREFARMLADDAVSDTESESPLEYLGAMRTVSDDDGDDDEDIPAVFCGMISVVPDVPSRPSRSSGPGGRTLPQGTPVPRWAGILIDSETHRNFLRRDLTWYNGIMGELYVRGAAQPIETIHMADGSWLPRYSPR